MTSSPDPSDPATATTHLYVLLDRSGSMERIREQVVEGLNTFVADQQQAEPDARLTLVQFDGQDPHEVLVEAIPLAEATAFTQADFCPRGNTPLFDATVRVIGMAATRAAQLADSGLPAEELIVVTVTDGLENASREFDLATVRDLVEAKQEAGWTFVFLSAALDAYADPQRMGYDERSIQSFAHDGTGGRAAFASVSAATHRHRLRRHEGPMDKRDFFEGDKSAEDDRHRRHGR